jgi:carbon-monoxide dehydrogenase medium subunit
MQPWQNYLQPQSVAEALEHLRSAPQPARVIAGGTDLLIDIQQGRQAPAGTLVDISAIPEMCEIGEHDGSLYVGAAATHYSIISSELVWLHAACLAEGCELIGGPQVRNVATIGGNVAHGLPAGDGTIGLMALDAEALVARPEGRHWLPMRDLFLSPGHTILDDEAALLVAFRLPLMKPGEGSAFHRIMRPQGIAIAILNMAAWVRAGAAGEIEDVRLAVGPAGLTPFRAHRTEGALRGRRPDADVLAAAASELASEAQVRTSPHRATKEYRQHLLPVVLGRVLELALSRAAASRYKRELQRGVGKR